MDGVVSAKRLTVPKRVLRGMPVVHIRKKRGAAVITPRTADDPLLGIGVTRTNQRLATGAERHNHFIYDGR